VPTVDLKLAARALPVAGSLLTLIVLFWAFWPGEGQNLWAALARFGAVVLIAFGVAAVLRYAVASLLDAPRAPVVGAEALRDRIAPIVLVIGSVAIVVLALGLAGAFVVLATEAPVKDKIDSLLMGIFTAVLPVFATWVGTVIAFYFTNESFRQAAQATREATLGATASERAIDRMIPYDRIAKVEIAVRADVRKESLERILPLFNDNITRVIVFEKAAKSPIFILRKNSPPMPQDWLPFDAAAAVHPAKGKTIEDYVQANGGQNIHDAQRYGFIAETASVEAARAEILKAGGTDLFVTATGQKSEPVLGWIPADRLR
jgi:hypothetical protein